MNSFKDGLRRSGQSVLDARAQNLYEMTKIEEERFIQECKMKVLRIKNELNKHRDLSVKSTTSLEVGNGFDPKAWVAKRHQLERDLRVANIEYALEDFLGYQHPANPISEEEAVKKAQEQYNVYHIHVTNGSYGTRIAPGWKDLLGQNVLTCDSHDVHNVIAEAIKQHEDLTGIPYEAQAVTPAYTPNSTSAGKENGTYTY